MIYDTLLLDADKTLFDFAAAEHAALTESLAAWNLPHDEAVCQRYSSINDGLWKAFEKGQVTRPQLMSRRFAALFEELGVQGDPVAFNQLYMETMSRQAYLLPGALEACRELCLAYRLYIITNGSSLAQRGRLSRSPLKDCLSGVFISEELGSQKPDPAFFRQVAEGISPWRPERTLVVGDSLSSDIQGALNAGLDCCWLNPKGLPYTLERPCTYQLEHIGQLPQLLRSLAAQQAAEKR